MGEQLTKVVCAGKTYYYKKGTQTLHREDGPAVDYASGYKAWYQNGKRHREGGPAVEYADGSAEWYVNGECHREDGPAVDHVGDYKEWYLNGKKVTEEEVIGSDAESKAREIAESLIPLIVKLLEK